MFPIDSTPFRRDLTEKIRENFSADNSSELTPTQSEEVSIAYSGLIDHIRGKKIEATDGRMTTEGTMLSSYRSWRGEHSEDEKARIARVKERNPLASEIFVRITKTKVQAAFGQISEILFADKDFPIGVEATPVPDGIADSVYLEPQSPMAPAPDPYGYPGDGNDPMPGATKNKLLAGLSEKYNKLFGNKQVTEGPSPDKNQLPQFNPAEEAALKMNKTIQDQLKEGNAKFALEAAAYEMVLYGTGIIKGPFSDNEIIHDWQLDPDTKTINYSEKTKLIPKIEQVSVWDMYPDPYADRLEDCEYVIQRHLLTKTQLRKLATQPKFDKEAIKRVLRMNPIYEREQWEGFIKDTANVGYNNRYEVLEYWGTVDYDMVKDLNLPLSIPEENLDVIQVNVWLCGNEILRIVMNPFLPQRTPYYFIPYEAHPHQLWGIGVPENMSDSQALMNGHVRMSIDNLNLAGNVMLEVNESKFSPGQDFSVWPGKTWRTQGPPGQSIFPIQFNNTAPAHIQMYDKARQLADEETGLPSYAHGQTGVSGMSRTAAGMSMLMSAAALNIKTVVKNIDRYGLEPMGNAYFQWNMQFNSENVEIRGDLKIVAKGTSSLMQKEVQTQRLLQLVQVASNPLMAPFLNTEYAFRQIAISMGLDPDKIVNDPKTAALYAQIMGQANGTQQGAGAPTPNGPDQGGQNVPQGAPGNLSTTDSSGGGGSGIGVGSTAMPGESGFSG